MRSAPWAAVVLLACAHEKTSTLDPEQKKKEREIEVQLMLAESPFGDGPHQRERERALAWLLEHADEVYPRLLARIDEGRAGVAVIDLLGRFGRPESIPRLERMLAGAEPLAWAAGQALALHPQPAAGEVLRGTLERAEPAMAVIAADALGARGDKNDCPALLAATAASDSRVRYHALQSAGKLGCLRRAALESLVLSDSDADVRALAVRLLESVRR